MVSTCPGFSPHDTFRKVCKTCRCSLDAHRMPTKPEEISKRACLRKGVATSDSDSGCILDEYAWVPRGITPDLVRRYFACLPEAKVPYIGGAGEQHRQEQLERQLPPHDSDARCCLGLGSAEERREHESFVERRSAHMVGRGCIAAVPDHRVVSGSLPRSSGCRQCGGMLNAGDVAVYATRFGSEACWHPACFVCAACGELLVDLMYFAHEDDIDNGGKPRSELYCGRHHAERLKPRCAACDEIIFADECTEAEDRCWHMSHFCCFECSAQLGGQRYVMRDDRPFCCACFEKLFADLCNTCGGNIGVDQGQMTHGERHWHATPACFRCRSCDKALLGKAFLPKADGATYCSTKCSGAAEGIADVGEAIQKAGGFLGSPPKEMGGLRREHSCDDRWTEDAYCRLLGENFSEGYGSLQNSQSLLRRSLPDVTAEESSDCDEVANAIVRSRGPAGGRLSNRRSSERSIASTHRLQRRLAFEERRSRRRKPTVALRRTDAEEEDCGNDGAASIRFVPAPGCRSSSGVVQSPAGSKQPPMAMTDVWSTHCRGEREAVYAANRKSSSAECNHVGRQPEQQQRLTPRNGAPSQKLKQHQPPAKATEADDDDGYQEGCRRHGGGRLCSTCSEGDSSSSSDCEDAVYEHDVARSRGLKVARNFSSVSPPPLVLRQQSAKVTKSAAVKASTIKRRAKSGNCTVQ